MLAIFIYVILGGLDAFTGSYETLTGWLGIVPQGAAAAVAVTAAGQVLWAIFFSAVQVAAYRRALGDWPAAEAVPDPRPRRRRSATAAARFDPRAVVVAALLATGILLCGTRGGCCSRRRLARPRLAAVAPGQQRVPNSGSRSPGCSRSPR